ncbi:MAG: permease, partial [Hyphomicrobiales bacterium]
MLFFTKPFYPTQFYRFFLACLIIITLAYFFWTGSRYPALDEKALMSGAIQLEDPLGFEALFPLTNDMSLLQKIAYSTLNWIDTNKKGMSFGILFAAGFLTIMPHFKRRSFHGGFANAFMGMLIGTPLGVCVNCAAPIARGMYSSGMRAETTLAAMIASPTLNIVVMTMLFSLLPFYMAVGKIALSILTILVIVPLICRILPQTELPEAELICPIPSPALKHDEPERFTQSLQVVFKSYLSNLWYIIRMTVPLMLLAGALGATTATLLPPELITDLSFSVVVLIAVVLVGLFLPAPIAFDVVVTGAMLSAGLAHGYVMALLFTLGTFSIYSFFIVAQSIGKRAAWLISGAVAALGIIAGVSAQGYYDWQTKRALEMLLQTNAAPYSGLWAAQAASADPWYSDDPNISITATSLAPSSPIDAQPFTRMEADQIGITKPLEFSFKDMWPPFWEGRSLSSGDIDRDGDIDVAIASTEAGFYLYENDGTGQFSSIQIDLGDLADLPVFHTVLVDINNDGWFDLFVATYLNGNFILYSNNGDF